MRMWPTEIMKLVQNTSCAYATTTGDQHISPFEPTGSPNYLQNHLVIFIISHAVDTRYDLSKYSEGIELRVRLLWICVFYFDRRISLQCVAIFHQLEIVNVSSEIKIISVFSTQADYENTTKEAEAHRRQQLRRQYILRKKRGNIGSPPPVKGRRHETIQTERYLEELLSRPIERSAECQTDLYLNPVPEPPYIQPKTGIDASTHIEEGDLFDFDVEVEPILDSLINITVKHALEEVMHEEQMASLRREKERYLALREAEMAELRRLEANEIRLTSEKQRRERFQQIANDLDAELRENVSAAKLLEGYVAQLLPEILETIQQEIANKNANELENIFLPWLAREVAKEVGQMVDARDILVEMVGDIVRQQAAEYSRFKAEAEFNVHVNEPIDDDDESTVRHESAVRPESTSGLESIAEPEGTAGTESTESTNADNEIHRMWYVYSSVQ